MRLWRISLPFPIVDYKEFINGIKVMYKSIINFWFNELSPKNWFESNIRVDEFILKRFGVLHKKATQGELYEWRSSPEGALAEIIILDQFSRNIYRDRADAFANDSMALTLAQTAVQREYDKDLDSTKLAFLYMPYMHSESKLIHEIALKLYSQPGLEQNLAFELKHKAIIDRFGRYPHRNAILNRSSTLEEIEFLKLPDSSF